MEKLFGNYFLGKSHFSYMKWDVFGVNFAIISGWSVISGFSHACMFLGANAFDLPDLRHPTNN